MYARRDTDESQSTGAQLNRWAWDRILPTVRDRHVGRSSMKFFDPRGTGSAKRRSHLGSILTRPFREMFSDGNLSPCSSFCCCALWELLVWGIVGGAITRIAALKFTRDEAPGLVAAL